MKRIVITALVCLFALGISHTAQAVVLAPGANIPAASETIASYAPSTTVVLPKIDTLWSHGSISGTLSTWIYRDNSDGYLIFAYQVFNDPNSTNGISALTVTDYSNFSTYAAYESAPVAPITFDRSSSTGNTIGFRFGFEAIDPDENSAILWVKTNATHYGLGETSIINGGAVNVPTYGPVVIPEPATMSLIGLSLLGLGAGRIRKRFKA